MARVDEVNGYGTHADRPAAGSAGSLYYESDTDSLFRDNGSTWDELTPGGGGGGGGGGAVQQILDITQTADNTALNSTSFATYPNLSTNTVTTTTGTTLKIEVNLGFDFVTGSAYFLMEVDVDGTTKPLGGLYNGTTGTVQFYGSAVFTGISAGSHTITLRYKVSAQTARVKPSGTLNVAGDAFFTMRVTEST